MVSQVQDGNAEVYEQIFAGVRESSDLRTRYCESGAGITRGDGEGRQLRGDRGSCPEPEGDRSDGTGKGVCPGGEDVHLLADAGADTRTCRMVGGNQEPGWAAVGVRLSGKTRSGRTRTRRGSAVRRRRDRKTGAAGSGSGDSGAGDTGGNRSHARGVGQRSGEAGAALCKSTPGS